MNFKSTDLVSLFEKSLADLPDHDIDEIGFVLQVGDAICKVHGLNNVMYNELVEFDGGNKGIVLNLDEDYVSVFLIYTHIPVSKD